MARGKDNDLAWFLPIHYKFFRPPVSLAKKTPVEVAGIKLSMKNWADLVHKAGKIQQ